MNVRDQLQVAHFRTARSKFGELKLETCGLLSTEVLQGLKTANLISSDNVTEAINSLSRGSSPGVDDMGLDFFFEHIDTLVAPRLSRLFALVLDRGEMRAHHVHGGRSSHRSTRTRARKRIGQCTVPADLRHHHPVPNLSQMRRTATERSDSTANRRSPNRLLCRPVLR